VNKGKSKSAFASWFKAQFGRDPMPEGRYLALRKEVSDLRKLLDAKELELGREDLLRDAHAASLYAWNVSDRDKKARSWE
jgi:hypothetical protein